jgi:hypothetical protein
VGASVFQGYYLRKRTAPDFICEDKLDTSSQWAPLELGLLMSFFFSFYKAGYRSSDDREDELSESLCVGRPAAIFNISGFVVFGDLFHRK